MSCTRNYARLAYLDTNRKLNESTINELASDGTIDYQLPPNPTLKDLQGCTALHIVTKHEDIDAIRSLLKNGADLTIKDAQGMTALHRAVECDRASINTQVHELRGPVKDSVIDSLLSAHIDYNITANPRSKAGISHLHAACITNNVEAVEHFLRHGVSIEECVDESTENLPGYTPLHFAARYCSAEVAKFLLDNGAEPHAKDTFGSTPFHTLIQRNMEIADWMCLGKRDKCGYLRKEYESNEKMMIAIMEKSEEEWIDDTGLSRLHVASILKDTSMLEKLLADKKTNVEQLVKRSSWLYPGYTALHFAAHFNPAAVKLLMNHGANMLAKTVEKVTPLDLCSRRYRAGIVRDVIDSHVQWRDICFSDGRTRLVDFIGAMRSEEEFRRFVGESLWDVDVFVSHDSPIFPGYTPLHLVTAAPLRTKNIDEVFKNTLYATKTDESEVYNREENESDLYMKRINVIIDRSPDFNIVNQDGSTALHMAFTLGRDDATITIAEHYSQSQPCDKVDREGLSHFQIAVTTGVPNLVDILFRTNRKSCMENNSLPDDYKYNGVLLPAASTHLHLAVLTRNLSLVKFFLEEEFDIYEQDCDAMTPIHRAFMVRDMQICDALLKWKAKSLEDREEDFGLTHIHVAAAVDNENAIMALMRNKADIDARISKDYDDDESLRGLTPLQVALQEESRDAVDMLIQCGAKVFVEPVDYVDMLYDLYPDLFIEAFEKQVDLNLDLTALHAACLTIDVDRVKKLLDEGAKPNARIRSDHPVWPNYTPLHMLAWENKRRRSMVRATNCIVKMMIDMGANVALLTGDGETPMYLAIGDVCREDDDDDLENREFVVTRMQKSSIEGLPMPERLEKLLKMTPVSYETQVMHGWNGDDGSKNILVKDEDPLTFRRLPISQSTDAIRGKVGYTKGLHVWDIHWSKKQRGSNAVIGVATAEASMHRKGYFNLVGGNTLSCGWDIKKSILLHGSSVMKDEDVYPRYRPETYYTPREMNVGVFEVPDKITVILDMDEGTLAYMVDGKYLGIAFEDLKGMTLFPAVSVVWGHAEITMKYIGGLEDDETLPSTLNVLLNGHQDFNVNPTNRKGISTFHIACLCNNTSVVEQFIKHGIDVNRPIDHFSDTFAGYTPLHLAAHGKFAEMVDILIEYGAADVHVRDCKGNTPLHCAAYYSEKACGEEDGEEVLVRLVRAGADIKAKNKFGQTPVEILMGTRGISDKIAEMFLKNQSHVNVFNGFNAGYIATAISRVSTIEDIFKHPVYAAVINNPEENGVDDVGRTPIHNIVSLRRRNEESTLTAEIYFEAIEGLMEVKFDIDQYDHEGQTPLHYAVKFQNTAAVRALLDLGADFNIVDIDGETPYSLGWKLRKEEDPKYTELFDIFFRYVSKLKLASLDVGEVNEEVYNRHVPSKAIEYEKYLKYLDNENVGDFTLRQFLSDENAVTLYQNMDEKARKIFDETFRVGSEELAIYSEFAGILRMQYRKVRAKTTLPVNANESGSLFSSLYSYLSWS